MNLDAWSVSLDAPEPSAGSAGALCLALPSAGADAQYAAAIARHPAASVFAVRSGAAAAAQGYAWRGPAAHARAVGWTLGADPAAATHAAARRLRAMRDLRTPAFALVAIAADGPAAMAVAGTLAAHLGGCALVGGVVAGDGAAVYVDGAPRVDAVALLLVETSVPFAAEVEEAHVPWGRPFVVTETADAGFTLTRLDGRAAASVVAGALADVGADPAALTAHPLWVQVRGQGFARCVRGVDGDGALQLVAGVERGAVVRLARRRPRAAAPHAPWTFAFCGDVGPLPASARFALATRGELTGGLFRSGACAGLVWGAQA